MGLVKKGIKLFFIVMVIAGILSFINGDEIPTGKVVENSEEMLKAGTDKALDYADEKGWTAKVKDKIKGWFKKIEWKKLLIKALEEEETPEPEINETTQEPE